MGQYREHDQARQHVPVGPARAGGRATTGSTPPSSRPGAETGRLSSQNPNLQNIPIRTTIGREIRGAFTTDPGWKLISCDYSQVELRILAHVSGEPALADAFRRGEDVHRATAAEVFGMQPADVNRTTRDRAKAVNFGIVYGISDFGLSDQLGIPRADARLYIDAYLARYPRVRSFIDTTIAAAAQDGYVTTLFGRRRAIPELRRAHGAAAPARRAPRREHDHPGERRRHHQGGDDPRPRRARGGGPAGAPDPPDPRRAAAGGARRRGRPGRRRRAPGDGRRLPARPGRWRWTWASATRGWRPSSRRADPYRVLQVHPDACPEVIAAAFGVLREMVLASDADDAPRRLAELNAAHRTLADPLRRAAHDAGGWHLAQVNVALPREPLDSPLLAAFVAALDARQRRGRREPGLRLAPSDRRRRRHRDPGVRRRPPDREHVRVGVGRGAAGVHLRRRARRRAAEAAGVVRPARGARDGAVVGPSGHRADGRGRGGAARGAARRWTRRRAPSRCGTAFPPEAAAQ